MCSDGECDVVVGVVDLCLQVYGALSLSVLTCVVRWRVWREADQKLCSQRPHGRGRQQVSPVHLFGWLRGVGSGGRQVSPGHLFEWLGGAGSGRQQVSPVHLFGWLGGVGGGHHQQVVITSNICSWKTSCSGNVHS